MVLFLTIVSSLNKVVYHHILWWMLLFISPFGCGANHTWAIFKAVATFHYTSTNWLIGILLEAYHNPQITGGEMITAHHDNFLALETRLSHVALTPCHSLPPHHHTEPQPKGCCTSPQRWWPGFRNKPGAWNSSSVLPSKEHPTKQVSLLNIPPNRFPY